MNAGQSGREHAGVGAGADAPGTPALGDGTSMGAVRLTVGDLSAMSDFYERIVGLTPMGPGENGVTPFGAGGKTLVELVADPDAPPRPPRSTGLFHLALLVPDRTELGRAIVRVQREGWGFTGASDHLVSEALYLDDPEGNGIEIYRDRPRGEWPHDEHGGLLMDTLPLDIPGVMRALGDPEKVPAPGPMPAGTTMGHVHLNVADIGAARAFYTDLLGFQVMVGWLPSALFVAAGGYHHHLGLNTWRGEGAPAPPPGSRGLRRFEIVAGDARELERIGERLRAAGIEPADEDGGLVLRDPFENALLIRV